MPSLKSSIGNHEHISLDDVCFLLTSTSVEDELGQWIETELPEMVYCSKLSITKAEYSSAGQSGHKPNILLVVNSDEYDGENKLDYERKTYYIYKTYMRSDGHTELYCEVRAGVN